MPKRHTEPIGDLFNWTAGGEDFPFIGGHEVLVVKPVSDGVKTYAHHPIGIDFYGKKYISHTRADEDEEQPGMHTILQVSDNGGNSFSEVGEILPEMSPKPLRSAFGAGRINYPTKFVPIGSQLYMISEVNDRDYAGGGNVRTPVGVLATPINSDDSIGTPKWVNAYNPNTGEGIASRGAPYSSSYPWYDFDADLRKKVKEYINRPNYFPKILFSWADVFNPNGEWAGEALGEPQSIQPIGYKNYWIYWKDNGNEFKPAQRGKDGDFFLSSVPEEYASTSIRFINYREDIIFLIGNSQRSDRDEIFFAIGRRSVSDGRFNVVNGDVYSITNNQRILPLFDGLNKDDGGEQLPHAWMSANGDLNLTWDVTKEEVYYKKIKHQRLIELIG
jgi:hypothetical protein